jgi:RNA polymerase sigma-70 factor (ECF subfamily)
VVRNAAEAEDAVQEAFLRVLKHREQLSEIRDLRVWLVRITWNVVLDKKRRSKTRPENEDVADFARVLPSSDRRADEILISSQEHRSILKAIDRLPPKEREALLLSAVDELATPEIAAVLGTTESSVRSRIFRARRELSEMLAKQGVSR